MTRRRTSTTGIALLVVALAVPAMAADYGDQTTIDQIQDRLQKKDLYDVDVAIDLDTAVLTGTVSTLLDRQRAEKIAGKQRAIEAVDNQIKVRWAERDAAELERDIQRALVSPHFNTVFDWVEAHLEGHELVLTGWVTDPWKIESAERKMASIEGIASIEAQLEVLPVSIFDDEIRYRAARALYGGLSFAQYGSSLNPPIHLVVRHGEVILLGTVGNRADQALARSLVSSATLPLRIVNRLETSKSRKT